MKKEVKLGLFIIVALVVLGYFIIKTQSLVELFSQRNRYPVYVSFPSVAGMYTAAAVRLAGIKIGVVDSIQLHENKARVRMMINKKYTFTDNARAIISTIGLVGEKFIEIVYKDEFKTDQPQIIRPGGEIQAIEPFNLDEVKIKFDQIYERVIRITDSVNDIVSDTNSKESLRDSFINLKSITANIRVLLAQDGQVGRVVDHFDQAAAKLDKTAQTLDRLAAAVHDSINDPAQGIIHDIKESSARLEKILTDLQTVSQDLRSGKGTLGKLLKEEQLYQKLDESINAADNLLQSLEKKKNQISGDRLRYGIHFDYFTRSERWRGGLDLDLNLPRMLVLAGVVLDPRSGDPAFTLLAGKSFRFISVSAGVFESELGAALRFRLFKERLNLDLFAAKFYGDDNPLLRSTLSFHLGKNLHLQASYHDFLNPRKREFLLGIGFSN